MTTTQIVCIMCNYNQVNSNWLLKLGICQLTKQLVKTVFNDKY